MEEKEARGNDEKNVIQGNQMLRGIFAIQRQVNCKREILAWPKMSSFLGRVKSQKKCLTVYCMREEQQDMSSKENKSLECRDFQTM